METTITWFSEPAASRKAATTAATSLAPTESLECSIQVISVITVPPSTAVANEVQPMPRWV